MHIDWNRFVTDQSFAQQRNKQQQK